VGNKPDVAMGEVTNPGLFGKSERPREDSKALPA
jgi:hypothetical protein